MSWSAFLPTFGVLFLVVMVRANATYWVGRGAAAGTRRLRAVEAEVSPRWQRAQRLVHRWGPIAVVLCFLTVGIQTAVNAVAGIVRMPLRRYLPAVTLGSLVWAAVYATVGLAAARAWLVAAARWPGTAAGVLGLLVVGGGVWVWRRRAAGAGPPESAPVPTEGEDGVQGRTTDMRS